MHKVLDVHPGSLLFARYAYNLYMSKNYDKAQSVAEEGVEKSPDYVCGRYVLALCYIEQKNYIPAITHLVELLIREPTHQAALSRLARLLSLNGDDKSQGVADYLARVNPRTALLAKLSPRNNGNLTIHEILGDGLDWRIYASESYLNDNQEGGGEGMEKDHERGHDDNLQNSADSIDPSKSLEDLVGQEIAQIPDTDKILEKYDEGLISETQQDEDMVEEKKTEIEPIKEISIEEQIESEVVEAFEAQNIDVENDILAELENQKNDDNDDVITEDIFDTNATSIDDSFLNIQSPESGELEKLEEFIAEDEIVEEIVTEKEEIVAEKEIETVEEIAADDIFIHLPEETVDTNLPNLPVEEIEEEIVEEIVQDIVAEKEIETEIETVEEIAADDIFIHLPEETVDTNLPDLPVEEIEEKEEIAEEVEEIVQEVEEIVEEVVEEKEKIAAIDDVLMDLPDEETIVNLCAEAEKELKKIDEEFMDFKNSIEESICDFAFENHAKSDEPEAEKIVEALPEALPEEVLLEELSVVSEKTQDYNIMGDISKELNEKFNGAFEEYKQEVKKTDDDEKDLPSEETSEEDSEHLEVMENVRQKLNPDEQKAEPVSEEEAFESMLVKDGTDLLPDHILTPTFAQIYLEQGQPYLAKQIYERLLSQDPENDEYNLRLEEVNGVIEMIKNGEEAVAPKIYKPRSERPRKTLKKSLKGKRIKEEIRQSLKEKHSVKESVKKDEGKVRKSK
jgi:tetratricopeptide (TPR) repeat protein